MWVIKTQGETYYIKHMECNAPWSTKETPDNPSTKGSIKIKNCLLTIDDDNCATITPLSEYDRIRLRNEKLGITRILFPENGEMQKALQSKEFKHSTFKKVIGSCGRQRVVCDLLDKKEVTFASLKYANQFRILAANEDYYKEYDSTVDHIKAHDEWEGEDEDEN